MNKGQYMWFLMPHAAPAHDHCSHGSFHLPWLGQVCAEQTQSCWGWDVFHHLYCSCIHPLISHCSQQGEISTSG